MSRFILLLIAIFVIMVAITVLLDFVFQRNKLIKYFPPLTFLALAIYYYYLSTTSYTEFEDIARILMAIMLFTAFISGLISGLFMDYVFPKGKRK